MTVEIINKSKHPLPHYETHNFTPPCPGNTNEEKEKGEKGKANISLTLKRRKKGKSFPLSSLWAGLLPALIIIITYLHNMRGNACGEGICRTCTCVVQRETQSVREPRWHDSAVSHFQREEERICESFKIVSKTRNMSVLQNIYSVLQHVITRKMTIFFYIVVYRWSRSLKQKSNVKTCKR